MTVRVFMQVYVYLNTTGLKQSLVSSAKYYNRRYILDILHISSSYEYSVHFRILNSLNSHGK